jgi:DNA-binding beta-propeller fold protein YncE
MRGLAAAFGCVVMVAACGKPVGFAPPVGGGDKLYEATLQQTQIAVIDSQSHAAVRTLPLGTPSPDWRHLYSVVSNTLVDTDPQTGATLHRIQLPGYYALPPATVSGIPGGLSHNGRWLTLQNTTSLFPRVTHFIVIDTTYASPPKRIDLDGDFTFDAISDDGQRLYLIEYLSGASYRVRMVDVAAGQLNSMVVFDKTDGTEAMAGTRISGVPSPDGNSLYSVYVRQNDVPFVHALDLRGPSARCINLPGSGYGSANGGAEFDWSLALTPDGSTLYAVNAAVGVVSEIDTSSQTVTRTSHFTSLTSSPAGLLIPNVEAKELGSSAAVLSRDGKTLVAAGGSGIVWIDTTTLQVRNHALGGSTIWGLGLSPDGNTLYALSDSGIIAPISISTGAVGTTFGPEAGYPMALMRVAAA